MNESGKLLDGRNLYIRMNRWPRSYEIPKVIVLNVQQTASTPDLSDYQPYRCVLPLW